jgi:hypothetical protein
MPARSPSSPEPAAADTPEVVVEPTISAGGAAYGDAGTTEPFVDDDADLEPSLVSPPGAAALIPPDEPAPTVAAEPADTTAPKSSTSTMRHTGD